MGYVPRKLCRRAIIGHFLPLLGNGHGDHEDGPTFALEHASLKIPPEDTALWSPDRCAHHHLWGLPMFGITIVAYKTTREPP
jgi:hypothetical protein